MGSGELIPPVRGGLRILSLRGPVVVAAVCLALSACGFARPIGLIGASPVPAASPTASGDHASPGPTIGIAEPTPVPTPPLTPEAQAKLALARAGSVPVLSRGGSHTKVVALTFDDGYSANAVAQILQILQQGKVAATFFPYARTVLGVPAVWKAVAAAGYPVGDHTYTHADLTKLGEVAAYEELLRGAVAIESVVGQDFFPAARPPYGAWTRETVTAAAACGLEALVLWTRDSRDWTGISVPAIVSRAIGAPSGSIVLMHAGPPNTVAALPSVIAWYRSQGYSFVTVPALLGLKVGGWQPPSLQGGPTGADTAARTPSLGAGQFVRAV